MTDQRRHPALELVKLYHQRWQIETSYLEPKSTLLGGRVLRARTPAGIDQAVHALLITYQAPRTAIADATLSHPAVSPHQPGFTATLHAARDQLTQAAGVITGTTIDLIGNIGRAILASPPPPQHTRISPRAVKRAISKHRAKGPVDRTNYQAKITISILTGLTADP